MTPAFYAILAFTEKPLSPMPRPPYLLNRLLSLLTAAILLLLLTNTATLADDNTNSCQANPGQQQTDTVNIKADSVELVDGEKAWFKGNVTLDSNGNRITASALRYDRKQDSLEADSALFCTSTGDRFSSRLMQYSPATNTGLASDVDYALSKEGRGIADSITFFPDNRLVLNDLRYTTCPKDAESWYLSVSKLEMDRQADVGVARHAVLRVQHIPVFYWPYVDFPLSDRRKSGLLAPRIGNSDTTGTQISLPYYFNINPQLDDTLTPRYLSDRGWQLQNEFRYMGRGFSGQLEAEGLWNDKQTNDDRAAARMAHIHSWENGLRASLEARWISDADYLQDFGDNLTISSQVHLPQRAELMYGSRHWQTRLLALDYQTVDDTSIVSQPYAFLPRWQLFSRYPERSGRVTLNVDAEWVRFVHPDAIQGERLTMRPQLSLPFKRPWGYFIPRVGADYISYDLAATPDATRTSTFEEQRDISTHHASIDTGLVFERLGDNVINTLEPRLFYAWRPYEDQDHLPVFDTRNSELTYDQLFSVNRFTGGDRAGDIDRLSLGLRSRIISRKTGEEQFSIAVAAGRYNEVRQVNIPAGLDARPSTETVTELRARLPGNWYAHSRTNWNHYSERVRQNYSYLQYQPSDKTIFNAGYRLTDNEQRQADISFSTPVGMGFTLNGRWNYDLESDTNLESYGGIEYKSCCWSLRLFATQRINSDGEQITTTLAQLELSGLAKLGSRPQDPLKLGSFESSPGTTVGNCR